MAKRTALFIVTLQCLFLCACALSWAGEVIVVKSLDIQPYNEALAGFKAFCNCEVDELTLSEDGRNDITRRVLDKNPDAVLAIGLDAFERLKSIHDLPVLYAMVPGPQYIPAGRANISGVSMYVSPDRNMAAIQDLFPHVERIGIVYDPRNSEQFVREAGQAAQARGVQLVARKVARPADVPSAVEGLKGRIDLLWMIPDATVINAEAVKYMLLFSFQNRIPLFTFSKKYVEMGAVAALHVFPYDMGAHAGELYRRLMQDRNAGPLRVDSRKSVMVVNGKIARKLGIKMREELVNRLEDVSR
ncbi:MAG: ABC transporter substrate binding protein [Nitrospiraceae bacterium]|nr:ABC transporter substrate binding protein [Nitrospiraceae bacterium]